MTPAHASKRATSTRKKKPKKLPTCTKKDLRKKPSKRRKCKVVRPSTKPKTPVVVASPKPSPTGPIAAPPVTTPGPDAFPTPPAAAAPPTDGLRIYDGAFRAEHAQRLMFRAGFGPRPGQARELAAAGVRESVRRLLEPGPARQEGPAPSGTFLVGGALAPGDLDGHTQLDLLDRQVRSTDQLTERMVLVLHDWFAVSESTVGRTLMPAHFDLLRRGWRGSFRQLLLDVTKDPAMLLFLDSISNRRGAPNENYGRELMELYGLGADRSAYTEDDVREMARALTGFRADYTDGVGHHSFRYDPARHDDGVKVVFAGSGWERRGRLSWEDAVHAVVDHPLHASFVVRKLWSYFIPTEPTAETQRQLEAMYRSGGERLQPLVEAILLHPDLHAGPTMVKPPTVFAAGAMRALRVGITTTAWNNRLASAGQQLGFPPNVSGWNDRAWLNTSTHSARWSLVTEALRPLIASAARYQGRTESSADAVETALAAWGDPLLTSDHLAALRRVSQQTWTRGVPGDYGSVETFLANRQNVLLQLIGAAPDLQVS